MNTQDYILLFNSKDINDHVTISVYEKWCDEEKKDEIANFIYERHYIRYLKPFEFDDAIYRKEYKNGFAMMANCCLLIETIESFYRGWEISRNELNFFKFFTRDREFKEFTSYDMPTQFYKHIRCGILHQGETTGGWTINRSKLKCLNIEKKEINANKFSGKLKRSLKNYSEDLKNSEWNSEIWTNLRKKMKSIIKNCG